MVPKYTLAHMSAVANKDITLFDVEKLPSIPQVLLKLIEKCHQVDVSFTELADIIQMDAALTAKVISTASASANARLKEARDFNRLLAELGLSTIRTIAITSTVHLFFSQHDTQSNRIQQQCWHHALTTAHIARSLAQLTNYPSEDEAYNAGLLHNIGQLLLLRKSPGIYFKIISETDTDVTAKEQQQFGINSIEAGVRLTSEWQLDSFLQDALRYQQEPTKSILDTPRLVRLINFAYKLSRRTQPLEQLAHDGKRLFGLNRPQLDELLSQVDNEIQQRGEQLGIALTATTSESEVEAALQDEQVNLELARQVRNIALLDSVRQHLGAGRDLESTLQIIQQDLNILFGLSHCLCFLYNPEENQLTVAGGHFDTHDRQSEFLIPVEQGRSLLAETLLQKQPCFSLIPSTQESLAVVDQQLIRLLEGEGILCLPLITEQQTIGVLVTGITKQRLPELKQQQRLMTYFANEAARAVEHWQRLLAEQQQLLALEHARQQKHTSKLLHEANNPLGIINNYLQLLATKLGEDHAAQSQLTILKEEIERVTGILMRMKDLPQAENIPQGEVDLNALVQDLLSIFRTSLFISHSIQESISLDDTIPPVLGNRNSLKQVITNLVKNAVEAMPEGGSIQLDTRGPINVGGELFIELIVADSGPGMADDTIKNLFKPIASTKGSTNSGLGLTIVKKLIADMRGTISCRSQVNGGTNFQVLLPMKER